MTSDHGRECLMMILHPGLCGEDVAVTLERLRRERGAPRQVQAGDGSVLISIASGKRARDRGATIDLP